VPGIGPCSFCYKDNNGARGKNMSFETFKKIFHKLPASVTQIAFGCGTLRRHPEMWEIFKYSLDHGVKPNLTINGDVDDHEFDKIAELCGACAVSIYDKELSYNAIKKLTDRGLKQCNIHYMISQESYEKAFEVIDDIKTDDRLKNLQALVFLSLKTKGRSVGRYNQLSQEQFNKLIEYAFEKNISVGFDSCSAQKFIKSIEKHPDKEKMLQCTDPCESTLYSLYIDVNGDFYPCSFATETDGWEKGLSVIDCEDFIEDIWQNEKTKRFREKVINCRECNKSCAIYEI
jgi:radical SAM protein with 4Fe4S-binding SPASM domain